MNLWLAKSVVQSHRASLVEQTTIMYSWHPMWVQSDQQVSLWLHRPGSSAKPPRQIEILVFRILPPSFPAIWFQLESSIRKWCQSKMLPEQLQAPNVSNEHLNSLSNKIQPTNHCGQVLLPIMRFHYCCRHTWGGLEVSYGAGQYTVGTERFCQTVNRQLTEWTKILSTR